MVNTCVCVYINIYVNTYVYIQALRFLSSMALDYLLDFCEDLSHLFYDNNIYVIVEL